MVKSVNRRLNAKVPALVATGGSSNLRGHSTDAAVILPTIARHAERQDYSLIVLDPMYKVLGSRD